MDLDRPRRLAGWLVLIGPALLTVPATFSHEWGDAAGIASADITPSLGKYRALTSGKIGVSARDSLYAKAWCWLIQVFREGRRGSCSGSDARPLS